MAAHPAPSRALRGGGTPSTRQASQPTTATHPPMHAAALDQALPLHDGTADAPHPAGDPSLRRPPPNKRSRLAAGSRLHSTNPGRRQRRRTDPLRGQPESGARQHLVSAATARPPPPLSIPSGKRSLSSHANPAKPRPPPRPGEAG
jgi:hypothetical protein